MIDKSKNGSFSQVFISSQNYDSKKLYKRRREKLLKKLDSFCVFAGMPNEPGSEEAFVQTWNKMVQEPALLYLTGINQAGVYLLLDPVDLSTVLFLPNKDLFKEFWNGKRLGFLENSNEVSKITGIKDVRPVSELFDTIVAHAKKEPKRATAYAYYFDNFRGDHNYKFKQQMSKILRNLNVTVKSASPILWNERLVLEPERIIDAKEAQSVTDNAFRHVLNNFSLLRDERTLGLMLDYEMQKNSDGDLAFPTIVAGGANACCLHYVKKDEILHNGDLVLLDFGIRIGTLHSDISRTVPVGGKFDLLQKLLYQIVLDAGFEYQKFVRPGINLFEISMVPWNFIMQQLSERFLNAKNIKNASFKLLYDVRPHGISHFIGEQIHEGCPGTRSLDTVLKPGMLISCEPGIYGEFKATINGKYYNEKIGIRIEDDLLITKNGFENISENIPKTIESLENLIK